MSAASQVSTYRPIGVLLGGPFAAQRSIEPKPVVCALLRGWERLADAAGHLERIADRWIKIAEENLQRARR